MEDCVEYSAPAVMFFSPIAAIYPALLLKYYCPLEKHALMAHWKEALHNFKICILYPKLLPVYRQERQLGCTDYGATAGDPKGHQLVPSQATATAVRLYCTEPLRSSKSTACIGQSDSCGTEDSSCYSRGEGDVINPIPGDRITVAAPVPPLYVLFNLWRSIVQRMWRRTY